MAVTYNIYTKSTLAAAWTAASSNLRVDSMTFEISPGVKTAVLSYDYGTVVSAGSTSIRTPISLTGQFVKIERTDGTDTETWTGYCPTPRERVDGDRLYVTPDVTQTVSTGGAVYTCYGLEYYLAQHTFDRTVTTNGTVLRAVGFNIGTGTRNNQIRGNRSAAKVGGAYQHDDSNSDEWTARDVVERLIVTFNSVYGFSLLMNGQTVELDNVTGSWNLDGLSYKDALDKVISPTRGFCWWMDDQTIQVRSIVDADIADPDTAAVLVPQNTNVLSLNLNTLRNQDEPVLEELHNSHYDTIVVRGGPIVCCFTMSQSYSSIEDGWSAGDVTTYDGLSDDDRRKEIYQHIFCRYRLPSSWNGQANGVAALPAATTSGGIGAGVQAFWRPDLRLENWIPIYDTGTTSGLRKPLVLVKNAAGNYQRVEKPAIGPSASVVMLSDDAGFQIRAKYPHIFGSGDFGGSSAEAAAYDPDEVLATVAVVSDDYLRYERAANTAEPGEISKTKIIDMPDAQLWVVAAGTVTDFSGATLVTDAGTTTRDDSAKLKRVADIAQAWYGRKRSRITLTYAEPLVLPHIGKVITQAVIGGAVVATGTIISRITHDNLQLTTSISTEFHDMDVAAIASDSKAASPFERRLRNVEAAMSTVDTLTAIDSRSITTPHQVEVATSTTLTIGRLRSASRPEVLRVNDNSLTKTASETFDMSSPAADGFIYYELNTTTGALVATLMHSATYPGDSGITLQTEVQTVTMVGTPSAGTFTLTLTDGAGTQYTTAAIAWDASAATIESAIDTAWSPGEVSVAGTVSEFTLSYDGEPFPVDMATADVSSLTGVSSANIVETTPGIASADFGGPINHVLAYVTYSGGRITSLEQMHYGIIDYQSAFPKIQTNNTWPDYMQTTHRYGGEVTVIATGTECA